jgi:hypothetical protein
MSGKRITTHINNLRPFMYDPIRTDTLIVAQHNEQESIVESIRNRRSALTFLVRFMHADKLHDYLRANKMRRHILFPDLS